MTTPPDAKPRHSLPICFLYGAVIVGLYSYAVYQVLHAPSPPATLPFLVGALVALIIWRLPLLPGLLVAVCGAITLEAFASTAFNDSCETGIFTTIVVGVPIILGYIIYKAIKDGHDGDDVPPTGTAGGRLVGLSGYAGAGKDTAAAGLLEDCWTRVSFADKLREFLYVLNPLVPYEANGFPVPKVEFVRLVNLVDRIGWTDAKQVPEVRALLQRLGTDCGRKILGENVWVDAVMRDLPESNIVFTDCRFENEAAAIKNTGGHVVRIVRPGVAAVNAHVSETALDQYPFDAVVNNDGLPDEVGVQLRKTVQRLNA